MTTEVKVIYLSCMSHVVDYKCQGYLMITAISSRSILRAA